MNSAFDRVHHVAISVADIKRSIHWYQTSFKCEVIYEDKRQAILQFENIRLVLLLPSQDQPHVAFVKSNAAEFGELRAQADGLDSSVISDPAGNPVHLVVTS